MVVGPSNYLEQLQTHIAYANFLCVSDSLKLTAQIHLNFIIYSLSICKDRKTMKRMGLVNWVGIRPLRRNHMVWIGLSRYAVAAWPWLFWVLTSSFFRLTIRSAHKIRRGKALCNSDPCRVYYCRTVSWTSCLQGLCQINQSALSHCSKLEIKATST